MIGQEFITALRRDLDADATEIAQNVTAGKCASLEEYRQWTGKIAGLQRAREIVDNLVKKANAGEFG